MDLLHGVCISFHLKKRKLGNIDRALITDGSYLVKQQFNTHLNQSQPDLTLKSF